MSASPKATSVASHGPLPRLWSTLYDEDSGGYSIVVPEGTTPAEALAEMVNATFGGSFDQHQPLIVEKAADLRIEVWRSCTKAFKEAENIDFDGDYWAPHGDGKRFIHVLYFDGDLWSLGEEMEAMEEGK